MMGPELTYEPGREEEPRGDLGLAAFRYIAAEMSTAEAEVFERRLAEDHAAREAVAEMVHLSELASAALTPHRAVLPARHWLEPFAWMAAGAAACLVLVATLYGMAGRSIDQPVAKVSHPPIAAPQNAAPPEIDSAALVLRTAELRDDGLAVWHPAVTPNTDADDLSPAVAAEMLHMDAEVTVPDWLLAAVSIGASTDDAEVEEN